MKVICIDASIKIDSFVYSWHIKEGEIYNVIEACKTEGKSGKIYDAYCLAEDPYNKVRGFSNEKFIPISDIDETEMIREQKVEVCDATN